nr:major facilitator superfamily domain-containing protein 9-like isoform X1 [Leptinotarsa decemlineata]
MLLGKICSRVETIDVIYTISFLDLFAVGLTFPLFATFLRDLGSSHSTIGLLSATYSGIQVLSGPLIGSWSDIRDRKTVLKTTLLICAFCYGLLGATNSVVCIFFLRIVLGIVKHTQTICKAMITDLIPRKKQSETFGKSASLASLGFIIGPFVGGNLSELKHGFTYVSILTAGIFSINYGIACLLPETTRREKTENISILKSVKKEFGKTVKELVDCDWQEHWDTFLLKFLMGLTMGCYFTNQAIYLRETYQMSQKHIGYMISFFSMIGMISGFCINKINSLYKADSIFTRLCHNFAIMTFSFFGVYLSPNLFVFLLLLLPLAFSATALRVGSMELMFSKSEKLHRGSLSGTSNSIMSVARFLTPLVTGFTSDILSEQSVMLVAVFPASLGLLLSWLMKRKHKIIVKNK